MNATYRMQAPWARQTKTIAPPCALAYTIKMTWGLRQGLAKACARQRGRAAGRAGQAMVEYVVVATVLLAVVAVMALFLYALRLQSDRVLTLVASDYP